MAPFRPVVGTLAYLWDRARDEILMIHRDARLDDDHLGKFNGLGGKLERDEDVITSLHRELHEEAGIVPTSTRLRGTVTWSGFGPAGEDWLGFVFLVDGWTGTPPATNAEGTLVRIARRRLLRACADEPDERAAAALPMWEGDRHFVPLVFDDDPRTFHGTMPYEGDRPVSWSYVRC